MSFMSFIARAALVLCFSGLLGNMAFAEKRVSLRHYGVSCDSRHDQSDALQKAFDAAANNAFTLVIDCPVFLDVGMDVSRPVFVSSKTKVVMSRSGRMIVNNVFIPSFSIVNAQNVVFKDWVVEYRGRIPIDPHMDGYFRQGKKILAPMKNTPPPAVAFNDIVLKTYLQEKHGVTFQSANPWWSGPVNSSSIFNIRGDSRDVTFDGITVKAAPNASADRYVPVVFSMCVGPRDGAQVMSEGVLDAASHAIPDGVRFSNIKLDGTLMGWLGSVKNASFLNIESFRYGDLQDENGEHVGGVGKWFPPPHLFYLNYAEAQRDTKLENSNIQIKDVWDHGLRLGVARDKPGDKPLSGYAASLKIGGRNIQVENYTSDRPDGFLDVLSSADLSISKVRARFSSQFLGNIFPAIRFPSKVYDRISFDDMQITDTAPTATRSPLEMSKGSERSGLRFSRFIFIMGPVKDDDVLLSAIDGFSGPDVDVSASFRMDASSDAARVMKVGIISDQQDTARYWVNSHAGEFSWAVKGLNSKCFVGGDVASCDGATVKGSEPALGVSLRSGVQKRISVSSPD
jgi:hypothetical protein